MTELGCERESLLRAVMDSPGDDVLRGVLADWLEENGDEGRASLLRAKEPEEYEHVSPRPWTWWKYTVHYLDADGHDLPPGVFDRLAGVKDSPVNRDYHTREEALADFVRVLMEAT